MKTFESLDGITKNLEQDYQKLLAHYSKNIHTFGDKERQLLENILKLMVDEQKLLTEYIDEFNRRNNDANHLCAEQSSLNRRTFFRIDLRVPLCSSLTVVQVAGKNVSLGKAQVCIDNIGPGGLAFLSNLEFPVAEDVLINFSIKLLNEIYELQGVIVRRINVVDNIFRYGVKFDSDNSTKYRYVQLFNAISVKLKDRAVLPRCSFCEAQGTNCIRLKGVFEKNLL
jgi:hypothetical protein